MSDTALKDLTRLVLILRREVREGFEALTKQQQQAPPWLSRWVGGPRDVMMWVLLGLALLRGDAQGLVGLITGYVTARPAPVLSTPVAPHEAPESTP